MDEMDLEVDLMEYLRVLARRKWAILAVIVASMVTAYTASSRMTKIYRATSTIMVKAGSTAGSMPFIQDIVGVSRNDLRNYMEFLKSWTVTEATLARLGWHDDIAPGQIEEWSKRLSIQQVQGADVAKLSVECDDPRKAAMFLNTLVEVFKEHSHQINQESVRAAKEFIAQQLSIAEGSLEQAEEALLHYKKSGRIVEPQAETKAQIEKIASLEKQLAEVEVATGGAGAERREIERAFRNLDPTLVTSTTLVNNPLVQQYRARLSELESELAGTLERYTDNHPTVISLRATIADVKDKLSREVDRIVGSETMSLDPVYQDLRSKLVANQALVVGLEARQTALRKLLSAAEVGLATIPEEELAVTRLARDLRVDEEIYLMLRSKFEEMRIAEAMKISDVYVVDRATVPNAPVKPRKLLNTAIAGVLGAFLAVGLAFVMEYLDTSLKTQEEVERVLDLPVLGMIPNVTTFRRRRRTTRRDSGSARTEKP